MLNKILLDLKILILSGALDFNLFPDALNSDKVNGAQGNDWQSFFGSLVNVLYNVFYILGVAFFGYKIVKAVYYYNTRSVHEIQKNQMGNEIAEPIIGLILFIVGLPVLKLIIGTVFPEMNLTFFK